MASKYWTGDEAILSARPDSTWKQRPFVFAKITLFLHSESDDSSMKFHSIISNFNEHHEQTNWEQAEAVGFHIG